VENMPIELAQTLYNARQAHKRVIDNDKYVRYSRSGKLDNGRVNATHTDDFYCLKRWIKRIEQARDSDMHKFYTEVDGIMNEMKNRSSQYSALSTKERENLTKLAEQPESVLSKY
jgi:hypothetical protein